MVQSPPSGAQRPGWVVKRCDEEFGGGSFLIQWTCLASGLIIYPPRVSVVPSTTFATVGLRTSETVWVDVKSLNSHVALGGRFSDGTRVTSPGKSFLADERDDSQTGTLSVFAQNKGQPFVLCPAPL